MVLVGVTCRRRVLLGIVDAHPRKWWPNDSVLPADCHPISGWLVVELAADVARPPRRLVPRPLGFGTRVAISEKIILPFSFSKIQSTNQPKLWRLAQRKNHRFLYADHYFDD